MMMMAFIIHHRRIGIVIILLLLLAFFLLFFFHLRYIDDDGLPIGAVFVKDVRIPAGGAHLQAYINSKNENFFADRDLDVPILVWWTPFTLDEGSHIHCGANEIDQQPYTCFVSNVRKYRANKDFITYLFYGTDFHLHDLPLPRLNHEQWGLLHEESPKNNYLFSYESIMDMFNHTATFKRQSDVPLTTQWLRSLDDFLDRTYVLDVKEKTGLQTSENLAPIIYLQSDCNTPSDRDLYIKELMKYIPIDSYGSCLNNKDLPENLRNPVQTMEHEEILQLVGKYKFALAFENAVCTDYITEKFWRPFKVGTVPIVYGSDRFEDFLPDNHSALSMLDFASPADLARRIHELDSNDTLYDSYRSFKFTGILSNESLLIRTMSERTWGIHNDRVRGNFIQKFECLVCERAYKSRQDPAVEYRAKFDHYGCPPPTTFDKNGQKLELSGNWYRTYVFAQSQLDVFQEFMAQGFFNFTEKDIYDASVRRFSPSFRRTEFLR